MTHHDADFFLELLPGPRDRDGLPDSLRFWKTRIEETDPDNTFAVGLIYGPSGCGKSSLVKAVLLPRLSESVISVYIEATPDETETRLLHALRKRCPTMDHSLSLKDTLAALRRGQGVPVGKKVLIVLDQFEQWLHIRKEQKNTELVQALRQCDGGRVQCLVMVRDDFWLAVSRFLRDLEVRLVEGENNALIDLFDTDHAKKVLAAFGRAFGRLPGNISDITKEQADFLRQAVVGLAPEGKVICVRLALFAEMMKGRAWTPAALRQVGGTEGIGATFLEQTFSAATAPPEHRYHQKAARAILKTLLPESGTEIKGYMQSYAELLEASGYAGRPGDFDDLIRILDSEIRLITPTDPEGKSSDTENAFVMHTEAGQKYFQLTHDYLVRSLRDWLTRKLKETRKCRSELMLAERSALWSAKPENRHLPSLTEWLSIRALTEPKNWTEPQRVMMGRASRVHVMRTGLATALLLVLVCTDLGIRTTVNDRQEKLVARKQEEPNQAEATRLVEGLLAANTVQVSTSIASLKDFRTWANPKLAQAFKESASDSDARLHAALALVADGPAVDPPVLAFLRERLLTVTPVQFAPVRDLLDRHKAELAGAYWTIARDPQQAAERRFHAACALATYDSTNMHWQDDEFRRFVAAQVVSVSPVYIGHYQEALRPVSGRLLASLAQIFTDPACDDLSRTLVTSLLADFAMDDPDTLITLMLSADAKAFKSLLSVLEQHQSAAVQKLEAVLDQRLQPDWLDAPLDVGLPEPSPAIRAQIESGHGMIAERFAFCQNMPLATFLNVAEALRPSEYRPTRVRPHLSLLPLAGGEGGRRPDEGVVNAASQPAVLISAIWTRDTKRWHLDSSLKMSDLPTPDGSATKDHLLLTDIAVLPEIPSRRTLPSAFPATEETPAGILNPKPQFIALWSEPATPDEQCRVLLDANEAEALQHLGDYLDANTQSAGLLYGAASFSAVASLPCKHQESGSIALKNRAVDLLRGAIRAGFADIQAIKTSYDFVPLHDDNRFLELLLELEPPTWYAGVWRADVEFESRLLGPIPVDSVLDKVSPLLAAGFRPFAIAVATTPIAAPFPRVGNGESVADRPNAGAVGNSPRRNDASHVATATCSIVLHRPIIPDSAKEQLAVQQAAAATALLRLDSAERVWQLLQQQPDPRLRSYLLHRLAPYGVDPQTLITRLRLESDISCRRALIQGLGEFAWQAPSATATATDNTTAESRSPVRVALRLLLPEQQSAVIDELSKHYADDPDPGIHGAAEWALRQRGADAAITEVRAAYSTGSVVGNGRWYLTKTEGKIPASSRLPTTGSHISLAIWCQDEALLYQTSTASTADKEQLAELSNASHRVMRGSSFFLPASLIRSALRSPSLPDTRNNLSGFRVARTMLPAVRTALSPAQGATRLKN